MSKTEMTALLLPSKESKELFQLEMGTGGGKFKKVADAFYAAEIGSNNRDLLLAFSCQCLPLARELSAPSIRAWAELLEQALLPSLDSHAGPWRLHVAALPQRTKRGGARRAGLIEDEFLALLKRHRKGLLARLRRGNASWDAGEGLVQLVLTDPENGQLSFADAATLAQFSALISPFPLGLLDHLIPEDKLAPSRAYRKLLEAELRFGHSIQAGESCVDLGASPGGWSYVALGRGARVTAVDRSPLEGGLMHHKNLEFVKGDAFTYAPSRAVDWLVCDVIAFPERSLELLERWIKERWCRRFVFTFKFKGEVDFEVLGRIKQLLFERCVTANLKHLENNKNEVTAWGEISQK